MPIVVLLLQVSCIAMVMCSTDGVEIKSEGSGVNKMIGDDDDNDHRNLPLVRDLDLQSTFRSLQDDSATCSNACDSPTMNRFRASFTQVDTDPETNDNGDVGVLGGHVFNRFIGGFLGRWTNGVLRNWFRHRPDNRKYRISTETILPLLSNNSVKIKSLVTFLQQESEMVNVSSSSSSEFVKQLYDLSAENMESIITVLDPIIMEVEQSETMDIRSLSCHMTTISTLLRDITLPNIEYIAEAMYTNSGNPDMVDQFHAYQTSKLSLKASQFHDDDNNNDNICSLDDDPATTSSTTTTTSSRAVGMARLFSNHIDLTTTTTTTRQSLIGSIILLFRPILFFPLSIVISLVGIVLTIIALPILLLFTIIFVPKDDDNAELLLFIVGAVLLTAIFAPVLTVLAIVASIMDIFDILLDPFVPGTIAPKDATVEAPLNSHETVSTIPHNNNNFNDILYYHLSATLASPLDMIRAMLSNENTFRDNNIWSLEYNNNREDMICEIATFHCQANTLLDVLPF
jgi:hypothetical protein